VAENSQEEKSGCEDVDDEEDGQKLSRELCREDWLWHITIRVTIGTCRGLVLAANANS
jgi:hypothetical protein